ncbi:MAG: MBL fold metallo-hydrolase [Bacilli bacterium]|nr:MBL fold metallo-hydrolase [Bacilli bacterium]
MSKRKRQEIRRFFVGLLLIIAIYAYKTYLEEPVNEILYKLEEQEIIPVQTRKVDGNLKVYFVDVGQGDCILIQNKTHNMVIDAGNNEDGAKLVTYFKSLGVQKIDYLVGTHAHEDHIGGMDDIIRNFEVKTFYMPEVITTTKTFEDVLDALEEKQIPFDTPEIDKEFSLGDASIETLYVGKDESDLNNTSIVLKLTYGSNAFLFTGDAESKVEKQILNKDISADILKLGHHGSSSSTSKDFLKEVNPTYAIASCEKKNSYGHPHKETLKKLKNQNVKLYRTDRDGTIIAISDGNKISIVTKETDTNG